MIGRTATRILTAGTLRYLGQPLGTGYYEWMTARVFVIEFEPGSMGSSSDYVTVIAQEAMFPGGPVAAPIGSIHHLPANDDETGWLITVDVESLVPA